MVGEHELIEAETVKGEKQLERVSLSKQRALRVDLLNGEGKNDVLNVFLMVLDHGPMVHLFLNFRTLRSSHQFHHHYLFLLWTRGRFLVPISLVS